MDNNSINLLLVMSNMQLLEEHRSLALLVVN